MKILRADLLHLRFDPKEAKESRLEYVDDAALLINDQGMIEAMGKASSILPKWRGVSVRDLRPFLLVPGFIDTHIHFPQMDLIGSCASSLLPWLNDYTFPEEARFRGENPEIGSWARSFTRELARQGTTLSVVFSSSDAQATDLLFRAFEARGLRAIIGKTSMNQHAPAALVVATREDLRSSEELIGRWHQKHGRLFYALTPRFAPSCSPDLLEGLAKIKQSEPTLYVQTHFAENQAEIDWVLKLFPQARDYLDVYEQFHLLSSRTVLAHCIHTSPRERQRLHDLGVIVSHCPTSNLFLGSGLMPFQDYWQKKIKLSLGTDVGAGTSFSLWQTMNEAYKVAQILGARVTPEQLFYAATLGAARALGIDTLGSLGRGFQADLQVLDLGVKESLARRWSKLVEPQAKLSVLIHSLDDRNLRQLFVAGQEIDLKA